jgi:hypothetical protein
MRFIKLFATSTLALMLTACPKDKAEDATPMTSAEASEAVDEANVSSQASALTSSSIEITTNFTIGKAVQEAAAEVRTFIQSQLPCADVALADATLTVTYGAKPGSCTYHGHTFSGSHSIKVTKNDQSQVLVDHTWTNFSNGVVKVSGTANVTWDLSEKFRNVKYDATWTRLKDGRTGKGTGDVTQTPLGGGLAEGIEVNGARAWQGQAGKWDLAIEGVRMRWEDPVPEAGMYRLASPKNRSLQLSFQRVDADTIQVTVSSGNRSFKFNVNSGGDLTQKS